MDEKKFNFRTLNSTDVFLMFKIIGKIGVNQFSECFRSGEVMQLMQAGAGENVASIVGMSVALDVANVICNNVPAAENEIYSLLATVAGMTPAQVRELDAVTFVEMVIEFVQKDEFPDFVRVVSKLFKREK